MRVYAMISLGGFAGAVLRFLLKGMDVFPWNTQIPGNTLMINVLGSLLLGFIIAIAEEVLKLQEAERVGIISGFLGAFTTFSTISKEISMLLTQGYAYTAILYIMLSVVLGLGAVWLGTVLGSRLKEAL